MRSRFFVALGLAVIVTMVFGTIAVAGTAVSPPGQPNKGYGSQQGYVCSGYSRLTSGRFRDGSRVTVYVPDTLKNGSSAPVVVFLHGFMMVAPQIYQGLIDHIAYQGNIVICPEINVGALWRMAFDTDQNVMMQRAVANANKGFALAGSKADMNNVYVVGHSLGGLMGACWMGSGGVRPRAIVLANPSLDATVGMPDFVSGFVNIKPIDWKTKVKSIDVPVMILTGKHDTLAPKEQSLELYNELTAAPSRVVFMLKTDNHGDPDLNADHNAVMCDDGLVPGFIMDLMGGDAEVDATDYRYYWAAVDAAMAGDYHPKFKMGKWSDGQKVKRVKTLAE